MKRALLPLILLLLVPAAGLAQAASVASAPAEGSPIPATVEADATEATEAVASPALATPALATPALEDDSFETEIVIPGLELDNGWLELTHLGSDLPPVAVVIGDREDDDEPHTLVPDLPPGPTMLCSAGEPYGVRCEEIYRGAGEYIGVPVVMVEFERGLEVRGAYVQDLEPVEGAWVSVVPSGLEAFRAYTMPLAIEEHELLREVLTDETGIFRLPELAPGEYFLETLLPSGRLHRGDPFVVPTVQELRRLYETDERLDPVWDLGLIEVPTGLDVVFYVRDPLGQPIWDATVSALQGETPQDVANFEGRSDREGRVLLHGLDVERPVRLVCEKNGYSPFTEDYELLPVEVECVLSPLGRVYGEALGPDGISPRGAAVTVWRRDLVEGTEIEDITVSVAADGAFQVPGLELGDYLLRVAAPGYRVEERRFSLDFGQDFDLGTILLLFAREVEGMVVDKATGEPIAGVDIRSLSIPGAVETYSAVDGTFSLAADEGDGGEPLVLEFRTFDYARHELVLTPELLRSDDPLRVEMEAAGFILALVERADGSPCAGCRVVLWPGGETLYTDAAGEALSGPLAEDTYRLALPRVTHLGSTVIEQGDAEVEKVRVTSGKTTIARLGGAGRSVMVRFDPALAGRWMLSARSSRASRKSHAEADGRFRVEQRQGEDLDLFLHFYDPEIGTELVVWQGLLPAAFLADELRLGLTPSEVRGRAVGLNGPHAGLSVRLVDFVPSGGFIDFGTQLRAATRTRADGTFRIPHVQPGIYALYLGHRNVKFVSVGNRQSIDLGTFELFGDQTSDQVY